MLKQKRLHYPIRQRTRAQRHAAAIVEYLWWHNLHFALVPWRGLRDKQDMLALPAPLRLIIDFALPERCPSCGAIATTGGAFCTDCWNKLHFLGSPACATCDLPLPYENEDAQQCAACLVKPPRHDGIKAAVAYGDIARDVALRLKYGGRIGLARMIAAQLMRHVRDLPADALLVPVPLHWTRLWMRSFNQSALIAREVAQMSGHEHCPDMLRRTRRTMPLGGLSRTERRKMLTGVIDLHTRRAEQAKGRHILLVDDVYTSGATSDACVRALKKGGANKVTILCWTRVLPQGLEVSDPT
jgi:ComF family protein